MHGDHLALALTHALHYSAHCVRRNVGNHALNRLAEYAVYLLGQYARRADGKLVALAAHCFDEYGQVHFAAPCDIVCVHLVAVGDAQGNVLEGFLHQPLAYLAGGNVLALSASERAGVYGERHFNGRLGYLHERKRLGAVYGADSLTDSYALDTGEAYDISYHCLVNFHLVQTLELIEGYDTALERSGTVVVVADDNFLVLAHFSALDTSDGDPADVLVVVDGGYQHLELAVGVALGSGNVLDYLIEQRLEVGAHLVGVVGGKSQSAGAENNRAVDLLLGSVQVEQKLQNLVDNFLVAGVGTVGLVNYNDDLVTQLERLLEHETGLRHGSLEGIHQQENAVYHLEDTLYLAGEIRVAGGIDDIDLNAVIHAGGVLRKNCDATLALDGVVVHYAVVYYLILAECAALLEHFVYQGGLAVVNVGDYCNVS